MRSERRWWATALIAITAVLLFAGPAAGLIGEHLPAEIESGTPQYRVEAGSGGEVYEFGSAVFTGSVSSLTDSAAAAGLAPTPSGLGYWIALEDGQVHAFGDAAELEDGPAAPRSLPIVDIAPRPSGSGYWLVDAAGRVTAGGTALHHGSPSSSPAAAIVAIEPTPTGAGYWLVGADGGVFSYGDAVFHGSAAGHGLDDVVDLISMPDGSGYWVLDSDGTVVPFGAARFHGSLGAVALGDVVGGAAAPDGGGYWLGTSHGSVYRFGSATNLGSALAGPGEPVGAIAGTGDRSGYLLLTVPGRSWIGPEPPAHDAGGQRVIYSLTAQRVWLINSDDSVFDSYLVSGKAFVPRPGSYAVYSKSRTAVAGHDGITMDHMVRFARGRYLPIGFHAIPTYANGRPMQTVADLGQYRSSGCVRQREDKAEQLYNWAPIGTTVVVLA